MLLNKEEKQEEEGDIEDKNAYEYVCVICLNGTYGGRSASPGNSSRLDSPFRYRYASVTCMNIETMKHAFNNNIAALLPIYHIAISLCKCIRLLCSIRTKLMAWDEISHLYTRPNRENKLSLWFPTGGDMNRNVHLIKLATDLKYRVKKIELYHFGKQKTRMRRMIATLLVHMCLWQVPFIVRLMF